ncbi:hypothetical protein [Marinobacter salsuginis]|uniref:hypothetical protein n=1 Tax=Marinobacter salsuginis TaxID=418719 RepID=UPI001AE0D885|nr:hypothetical protein [Marinobacter salsuginis]QTN41444.1 hypothetical protein HZ997_17660 [Marinobacter salsuginis]
MSTKHAFLFGIVLAVLFDIYQAIISYGNGILLAASIFCILITIYGLFTNLSESEELRLQWMLAYIIPTALVAVGMVVDKQNFENGLLIEHGHAPNPNSLPGESSDYLNSVGIMFFSFTIPLQVIVLNIVFHGLRLILESVERLKS